MLERELDRCCLFATILFRDVKAFDDDCSRMMTFCDVVISTESASKIKSQREEGCERGGLSIGRTRVKVRISCYCALFLF